MAMAAYIIGMQEIASLASPKKRVVEQGFLEFFQDDGQARSNPKVKVSRPSTQNNNRIN
jgi:hypothetical protein